MNHHYGRVGKRLLDIGIAATALLVLLPVMVLVALVVRCTMGAPILFRQRRPGLSGKPFVILKFRTLRQLDGMPGDATDGERLELAGRILRTTSLDELPQLINVLKGDMSLVGPRPLLMQYLGSVHHDTGTQARGQAGDYGIGPN